MHPAEIKALAKLIDELDYYQLLETQPGAAASELKSAYYALSRRVHPDANRHQEAEVRRAAERVAKRLTEAWSVLRDPRRRKAYDAHLAAGGGSVRLQLSEAEAVAERKTVEERLGHTPNGRRFYTLAHADIDRGDLASAARNLKMALTYEPGNAFFKEQLEKVRKDLDAG
jgi:curved DNA-binding protein CbpA